ncbi:MAG TPA: AMP-binding protein [Gaiellaceae bacterium]|nr:AMP-binding protein [Gaiellaceae bacterium]
MTTWARYFDERIETMPPAWTRRLEEERLAEQVSRCYDRSPFYRRKLEEAGVRPEHVERLEDLAALPFTTKEELRASQAETPPYGDYVCVDGIEIVRMHLSSGTTGKPLVMPYTERDIATSAEVGARAFWAAGVRPDDTLLHCLSYSFYTGGISDHAALEATGAAMIPVGLGQSARVLELWRDLRPTALFSTITYPVHLAETAAERGLDPRSLGLAKLVVTGEPGGQIAATRRRLEELWGAEVGDTYGLSEVWGTLAGECEERAGLHFSGQDATLVELIEPESGERVPVEEGARGELVFTHLYREAAPVIRFRSRDVAEILGIDCPCGRTGFRFRVVGRSDDMFRVRGINVFPSAVEELMREQGVDRFAIVLDSFPVEPPVRILVEGVKGRERELAQAVRARLDFTCEIAAATLPRSEAKSKRLYRVYDGEEAPA